MANVSTMNTDVHLHAKPKVEVRDIQTGGTHVVKIERVTFFVPGGMTGLAEFYVAIRDAMQENYTEQENA